MRRLPLRLTDRSGLWPCRCSPPVTRGARPVNRAQLRELREQLSVWYFSESGGMFLLPHARDFYFALQDFAQAVSNGEDWECRRSNDDPKSRFNNVVDRMKLTGAATVMATLPETAPESWPEGIGKLGKLWHSDIQKLGVRWKELGEADRFAVVQQVGSVLRTNLANDVESRLR